MKMNIDDLQVYLVGGAVRDELLNRTVHEKDWVVVGSTPAQMLACGFLAVGKEFPVFLHPHTKEEYALARTERKIAPGYKGFAFNADTTVSLEEDLKRRDLTMNAIAKLPSGDYVDPYGGRADIKARVLRHVSNAFQEDPVRLLRVARFAAQLPEFSVADTTVQLLKSMVQAGEINHLVPERVFKELQKALETPHADKFFAVLEQAGALKILCPEWQDYQCVTLGEDAVSRFMLLCADLNEASVRALAGRLRVPSIYLEMALLIVRFKSLYQEADSAEKILDVLQMTDALRRPERLRAYLKVCALLFCVDKQAFYERALHAVSQVNVQEILNSTTDKRELATHIRAARLSAIRLACCDKKP